MPRHFRGTESDLRRVEKAPGAQVARGSDVDESRCHALQFDLQRVVIQNDQAADFAASPCIGQSPTGPTSAVASRNSSMPSTMYQA